MSKVEKRKEKDLPLFDYLPVFDEIDLDVDLSTAAAVSLTKKFDYITQVIINYTTSDAAVDQSTEPGWTGLQIRLDDEVLFTFSNIVNLYLMGEVRQYEDDNNIVTYQTILDFTKCTPGGLGLQIEKAAAGDRVFDFYGQDDMTGATRFRATVMGYRLVS